MDITDLDILNRFNELSQDLCEHIENANRLKDQIENMAMVYEDIDRQLAGGRPELILKRQRIEELL